LNIQVAHWANHVRPQHWAKSREATKKEEEGKDHWGLLEFVCLVSVPGAKQL